MSRRTILLCSVLALMLSPAVLAQDQERGERGERGERRERRDGEARDRGEARRGDMEQMRSRWMGNIREQLGASEEEWQVISPKLEKLMAAQRDARGGFGFGMRGGQGREGGDQQAQSPTVRAMQDLRSTLQNESASAEEISRKLTALREARTKAQADLQAAQKELKELLTQRQEAALVMMGMLE